MYRIILSGIKHSGKSTVGWALASRLRIYFADLDDLILRDTQKYASIRNLYKEEGKSGFQKREAESLNHFFMTTRGKSFVLSLGGGTVENREAFHMLKHSDVSSYYLDASEEDLYQRIMHGGIPPFLEGENPVAIFSELYRRRSDLYLKWADHIIDTRGKTPAQISGEIEASINQTK